MSPTMLALDQKQSSAPIQTSAQAHQRSYANVILVERVLAVLQSINRLPTITVQAISRECDIPPSSVIRILETLCAEGFLIHVSRRGGYVLTSKVKLLSAGFHGSPLVVEVLQSYADALTRKHLWPLSVATLEHDAMVVQYSSIPLSPHAHVRTTLHKRLSLISRAHGLAYLAFCSSAERHRLARIAVKAKRPEDAVVSSARDWRSLIHQARRRGYAVRAAKVDPLTCTIAVPIMIEPRRVVATLGMTFFRSVVREPQIASYASALTSVAAVASERLRLEIAIRNEDQTTFPAG
jgi:IclR family mhp operon transcriptional activator